MSWFQSFVDWMSHLRLRPIGHATLLATDANHAPILTVLMVVHGTWPVEAVANLVSQRMAESPTFFRRFRSRVRVDTDDFELLPEFKPASHVYAIPAEHRKMAPLEFAELMATQELDMHRPLWTCHVLPARDSRTFVLWRIHHALADGASVHALFARLSDNPPAMVTPPTTAPTSSKLQSIGQLILLVLTSLWLYMVKAMRLVLRPEPRTRLTRASGRAKRLFYTTGYSVHATKAVAKHLGAQATANDVFLACITGALRTMLMEEEVTHGASSRPAMDPTCVVRAGITVDMRKPWEVPTMAEPDNRFSCLLVDLPLGETCPVRRLHRVMQSMNDSKNSLERYITFGISVMVAQLPTSIMAKIVAFLTSHSSVAISNVRGPPHVLYFDGHPLESLNGFVAPPPHVNMGVAIYSMADALGLSVQIDASVFRRPERFLVHVQREYDELQSLAAATRTTS